MGAPRELHEAGSPLGWGWRQGLRAEMETWGRDRDPGQGWGPRAEMGTQGRDADLGCYWDHCSGWCWEGWGSNWGPAQGHFECCMKWRMHCPHRERWVHGTRVLPHPPKAICAPITSGARRAPATSTSWVTLGCTPCPHHTACLCFPSSGCTLTAGGQGDRATALHGRCGVGAGCRHRRAPRWAPRPCRPPSPRLTVTSARRSQLLFWELQSHWCN